MCPSPSRHGLSQTLHRCSSRSLLSTTRYASSPSPRLHPSLSPDALLCSPLSGAALLPSLATPLPDLQPLPSPSRSSIWWRNGAEDGEEAAESTRRRRNRGSISLSIRRQGAALPLRRAWSAPTPKRRLSDD